MIVAMVGGGEGRGAEDGDARGEGGPMKEGVSMDERGPAARGPGIKLDQFLKWAGITPTGGQAKLLIRDGEVRVNGEVETRRGRRLHRGDRVEVAGQEITVDIE